MDGIISEECIFFNPKTMKCHRIDPCEKLGTDCLAKERMTLEKKDDIDTFIN